MNFHYKNFLKYWPVILPVLIISFAANYFLLKKFEARRQDIVVTKFSPKPAQHELVFEDPRKYHFAAIAEDASGHAPGAALSAAAGLKLTPAERQNKLKLLDRQIKSAERQTRAHPNDPQAKEKLTTLYTQRAFLVNLAAGL